MNLRIQTGIVGKTLARLSVGSLLALVVCLVAVGCKRETGPPPPLPAEQIPAALQKAFAKAPSEVKDLVGELDRALQSKDYPAAYQRVQALCAVAEATPEQRMVSTRAMLTLTTLLQSAQAQGDKNAASVLQQHQRSR